MGQALVSEAEWVYCERGHSHWGRYGAAGLLLTSQGRVLLGRRAITVHLAGLWGLPGGARARGETAADAARRETLEETGLPPDAYTVTGETSDDHGDWAYTTVTATLRSGDLPLLVARDGETERLAWVPLDDALFRRTDLHPGLPAQLRAAATA